METLNSLLKKKKACKEAISANCGKLFYSRSLGGYQVRKGFTTSEVEYPFRDGKRLVLSEAQLDRLYSYSVNAAGFPTRWVNAY
jgi:hypothetical protein